MHPFTVTPEFEAVFGSLEGEIEKIGTDWSFPASNIDCLFENIMMTENGPCCIDYEWVFFFPVPITFIKYRMLYYFYEQYKSIMSYESLEEFMTESGIEAAWIPGFMAMERNFQDYVHGENQQIYLLNYMDETIALPDDMYELTKDPKKWEESQYWKSIELSLMRKAAVSYYPSYVEQEAIRLIEPRVKVKAIVAYVYEQFLNMIPDDFEKREGLLFVGGFAHPPNADAVLWFAKDIFPLIREKLKVNFYIVGSRVTDEIKALEQPHNGIIVKGFVSEEELAHLYETTRIVVVPLRYGAGVKGKVIEAIYNGAPIVTTSIGAEGIPEAERVMRIQDNTHSFAQEVIALYQDIAACKEMCRETQQYIREFYSIDAAWEVVGEDF